jgi:hypothetical protein
METWKTIGGVEAQNILEAQNVAVEAQSLAVEAQSLAVKAQSVAVKGRDQWSQIRITLMRSRIRIRLSRSALQ